MGIRDGHPHKEEPSTVGTITRFKSNRRKQAVFYSIRLKDGGTVKIYTSSYGEELDSQFKTGDKVEFKVIEGEYLSDHLNGIIISKV